jgi:hypothetical protein
VGQSDFYPVVDLERVLGEARVEPGAIAAIREQRGPVLIEFTLDADDIPSYMP